MPPTPKGRRADDMVFSLLAEDTWITKSGTFEADKEPVPSTSLTQALKHQELENDALITEDQGKHEPGFGLAHPDSTFSSTQFCRGLGKLSGGDIGAVDGVTAELNPQIRMVASCLGEAPVLTAGTAASGVPTTTSVEETVAGGNSANTLRGFQQADGSILVRPVLTDVAGALGLALELPVAPSDGDLIAGAASCKVVDQAGYPIQGDLIGGLNRADLHNAEVFGCVGTFSLPETSLEQAQRIEFQHRVAAFTRPVQKVQVSPGRNSRPHCGAGGELIIARFGNTAYAEVDFGNFGLTLNRSHNPDPRFNGGEGIGAWISVPGDTEVVLYLHANAAMPPGFGAITSYQQAFEAGGHDNLFHILYAVGRRKLGHISATYVAACHLAMEPEPTEVNNVKAQKLVFHLAQGVGPASKVWHAHL